MQYSCGPGYPTTSAPSKWAHRSAAIHGLLILAILFLSCVATGIWGGSQGSCFHCGSVRTCSLLPFLRPFPDCSPRTPSHEALVSILHWTRLGNLSARLASLLAELALVSLQQTDPLSPDGFTLVKKISFMKHHTIFFEVTWKRKVVGGKGRTRNEGNVKRERLLTHGWILFSWNGYLSHFRRCLCKKTSVSKRMQWSPIPWWNTFYVILFFIFYHFSWFIFFPIISWKRVVEKLHINLTGFEKSQVCLLVQNEIPARADSFVTSMLK